MNVLVLESQDSDNENSLLNLIILYAQNAKKLLVYPLKILELKFMVVRKDIQPRI